MIRRKRREAQCTVFVAAECRYNVADLAYLK